MGKKKREHVTFDRMADPRVRVNKKAFVMQHDRREAGRYFLAPRGRETASGAEISHDEANKEERP
ncbi:MAG: hypothetical protein ACM3XN_08040 [Chloroflexota bacterium]